MFAEHNKGERTIKIFNIQKKEPQFLEIEISYKGETNVKKAVLLDNCIIPFIVRAFNLLNWMKYGNTG